MTVDPWPEDNREMRAKRIALSYRGLCQRVAQNRCDDPAGDLHRLDQHWLELGSYWVLPDRTPLDYDDWVNLRSAAHFADRSEATIRVWAHRGVIETRTGEDGTPEYLIESLVKYGVEQGKRRAHGRK